MSGGSWRDRAAPIIAKVLADTAGQDERQIRTALFDAYPFILRGPSPRRNRQVRDDATLDLFN